MEPPVLDQKTRPAQARSDKTVGKIKIAAALLARGLSRHGV